MAKNDLILLDSILDQRVAEGIPSNQRDEVFEYLAYQQILKDYDLSHDELLSGSVDGRNDGGIDAIYVFVNGHLVTDISTTFWPKSNGEMELYIFSCKHRDSFKQEPINSIIASLEELLDLSLLPTNMKGEYNSDLLEKRNIIALVFRKLATILCSFKIFVIYACRGSNAELGDNVRARGEQVVALCKEYFSSCEAQFQFWGSEEILKAYRELPNYSLSLGFQECLTQGEQYVLLVKLNDYYDFITNEDGKLRKYLFDSNVRDFMGLTAVNEDILRTLGVKHDNSTDFWWLNNGVTILSTGATIVGKSITINNVQIVNGLQTSECIYRHFQKSKEEDQRFLLIKVLTSNDEFIRDAIIRATNNQTQVQTASLRATDKIQRDIEDILRKSGLYYERRINYYTNQGIPNEIIFSPLYMAAGYTALILKLPHKATGLKSRFMREPQKYNAIFSEDVELKLWPKIALILRKTDKKLEDLRPKKNTNLENYLKSVRYVVSLLTVGRIIGHLNYSNREFLELDMSSYTDKEISDTWFAMQEFLPDVWNKTRWKNRGFALSVIEAVSQKMSISGFEAICNRDESAFEDNARSRKNISNEFLKQVQEHLPKQPWPEGIHKLVSQELAVSETQVIRAIKILIKMGVVNRQKDGVVYDKNGNIIAKRR